MWKSRETVLHLFEGATMRKCYTKGGSALYDVFQRPISPAHTLNDASLMARWPVHKSSATYTSLGIANTTLQWIVSKEYCIGQTPAARPDTISHDDL